MDYMLREFTPNIMNFWIIAIEFQAQAGIKKKDGTLKGDEKTLMADAMGACAYRQFFRCWIGLLVLICDVYTLIL